MPPVLVSVTDWVWVLPTSMFPKPKEEEFGERNPAVGGADALPESETPRLESDALEPMLSIPLAVPLELGVKATVIVALWPAARDAGAELVRLNPEPLTAA